jgi:hypothetical protein
MGNFHKQYAPIHQEVETADLTPLGRIGEVVTTSFVIGKHAASCQNRPNDRARQEELEDKDGRLCQSLSAYPSFRPRSWSIHKTLRPPSITTF